jgi:predicted O-methyltransferase YrrM
MSRISKSEVAEAVTKAFKIPGLYGRAEGAFLYKLGRIKSDIVEIGCWKGRTTAILVQAASAYHAKLTSIDPFIQPGARFSPASADGWRKNLEEIGLTPPTLLEMTSVEAFAQFPENTDLGLVFIDGNHSCEAVTTDIELWSPKIKPGGILAFHDMWYPGATGVTEAISSWWLSVSQEWKFIGQTQLTVAFRKRTSS